jgi:hypothetical protein
MNGKIILKNGRNLMSRSGLPEIFIMSEHMICFLSYRDG